MLLLVKCYDNKMVKLPGVSSIGKPHMQLTNKKKIIKKKIKINKNKINPVFVNEKLSYTDFT